MSILDGVLSVLSGGATGLIGTAIHSVVEYKTKKLEIDGELAKRKLDADIMAQEWASRTKVAEVEGASAEAVEDAKAFATSYNEPQQYSEKSLLTQKQNWALVFLDVLRGSIRPFLTIYLCGVTTLIYIQARQLINGEITQEQAYALTERVIETVLYLSTVCITWWFGTRTKSKK